MLEQLMEVLHDLYDAAWDHGFNSQVLMKPERFMAEYEGRIKNILEGKNDLTK